VLTKYPQVLLNVRVRERRDPLDLPDVREALDEAQKALNGAGRVLVRLSGTEPLARVMVEGRDAEVVRTVADTIAQAIERVLGPPRPTSPEG
jgi:phosphoglucosamine mutase